MHSMDHHMFDANRNLKRRDSSGSTRRSVASMKTLLPLRLLSPSASESNSWPSSSSSKRSTFGIPIFSQEEGDITGSEAATNFDRHSVVSPSPIRPRQYRDIPIYTEPGSPLFSLAYYTGDALLNSSLPASAYDDDECSVDSGDSFGCDIPRSGGRGAFNHPEALHQLGIDMEMSIQTLQSEKRSSELSFKCSGQSQISNEISWLRSPLNRTRQLSQEHSPSTLCQRMPVKRRIESWLSDPSSCDGEESSLACATALTSVKPQVIDLNSKKPSGLAIQIPKRSSSLGGAAIIPHVGEGGYNGWMSSYYSPPVTPDYKTRPSTLLPRRRLDIALTSPPQSPIPWNTSAATCGLPVPKETKRLHNERELQCDLDRLRLESANSIITELDSLTSDLPSTELLPETRCISAIRSEIFTLPLAVDHQRGTSGLRSPFREFNSTAPRRKTTNFSKPTRSNSASTSKSWPQIHQNCLASQPPIYLSPPDLQPLARIFPRSSDSMISSLYAHIVAHLFITTLQSSQPSYQSRISRRKRRDTPYWMTKDIPSKAVSVLGMSDSSPDLAHSEPNYDYDQQNRRLQELEYKLRRNIHYIITSMDSQFSNDDPFLGSNEFDLGPGHVMLRALEEVVKTCETRYI